MEVRVFVKTSWKGPERQDGVAAWLAECMARGEPVTRQGFVHLEDGTQARGTLMALANALYILKKPCSIRIYVDCGHVQSAVQNGWHRQWRENGWKNAKGKEVRNADVWEILAEKAAPHTCRMEAGRHEYTTVMQDAIRRELEEWKRRTKNGRKR